MINIFYQYATARLFNVVTIILWLGIFSVSAQAATTVTFSDEVFGNNSAGRTAAATLDDTWAASFPTGIFSPDLFSGGSGYNGSKTFTDVMGASYQVDWQAGYIDDVGFGIPASTTFMTVSSGSIIYNTSNVIQSGAPNPFATETRLSTGYSASGMSAIQLDFSNSTTPIYEFGIFAGDVESRPNNGTVGRVIVYDTAGAILRDEPIIYTGTVLNGTNYTVTEPLGSPSGSVNNNNGDWGNGTTVFLTIKSDQVIGKVIIHTGDDDHTVLNTATSEQLGLVGFQLPNEVQQNPQGTSQLALKKTVENTTQGTAETEIQNQAKSGDILKYRIYYRNTGTELLTHLVINDTVPDFTVLNGLPVCELPLPASFSSCTPAVTGNAIRWTFPANEGLKGGDQGVVSCEVQIE